MRHGKLRKRHHLKNIAAERRLDIVDLDILIVFAHDLLAGVVDKNIEATVLLHVRVDNLVQVPQSLEVERDELAFAASGLDDTLGLLGVLLLRREVNDGAIATLASVEGGNGTASGGAGVSSISISKLSKNSPNARITTSDDGGPVLQLSGALVLDESVGSLKLGGLGSRSHVFLETAHMSAQAHKQ